MATLGPESQINFRYFVAGDERWRLKVGHFENIFRDFEDVVTAIANDSSQRRLLDLSQLFRLKNTRTFIPESKSNNL